MKYYILLQQERGDDIDEQRLRCKRNIITVPWRYSPISALCSYFHPDDSRHILVERDNLLGYLELA